MPTQQDIINSMIQTMFDDIEVTRRRQQKVSTAIQAQMSFELQIKQSAESAPIKLPVEIAMHQQTSHCTIKKPDGSEITFRIHHENARSPDRPGFSEAMSKQLKGILPQGQFVEHSVINKQQSLKRLMLTNGKILNQKLGVNPEADTPLTKTQRKEKQAFQQLEEAIHELSRLDKAKALKVAIALEAHIQSDNPVSAFDIDSTLLQREPLSSTASVLRNIEQHPPIHAAPETNQDESPVAQTTPEGTTILATTAAEEVPEHPPIDYESNEEFNDDEEDEELDSGQELDSDEEFDDDNDDEEDDAPMQLVTVGLPEEEETDDEAPSSPGPL